VDSERGKREGFAASVIGHFGDDEGGDEESNDGTMKDLGGLVNKQKMGLWFVVYGMWYVDLWFVVYGMWYVDLWFVVGDCDNDCSEMAA
jgi:hypothetical protein